MEPGYEFAPADHDLTDDYLAVEIAGHPVVSSFIHHGDVYSAVPDVIASGRQLVRDRDHNDACYIISPVRFASVKKRNRKLRMIDDDPRKSFWHSEKGKIPLEGSKSGGYVQDFVQAIKGTDGHTERLGWRMKETRVRPLDGAARRQRPRSFSARSTARLESRNPPTASTSATPATRPAEDVPVYSDDPAINSKKRKPADGDCPDDSRSSARPRLTEEYAPLALRPEPESAEDMLRKFGFGAGARERPGRTVRHVPPGDRGQANQSRHAQRARPVGGQNAVFRRTVLLFLSRLRNSL
jgi:hypothetical protein